MWRAEFWSSGRVFLMIWRSGGLFGAKKVTSLGACEELSLELWARFLVIWRSFWSNKRKVVQAIPEVKRKKEHDIKS